ncbi:MAG: hypothetical protein SFZ03_04980 [Candidatus Melainabacteria bacterium]|nr:hypothetical protein [Candidatus Melainabacteria bacterium]
MVSTCFIQLLYGLFLALLMPPCLMPAIPVVLKPAYPTVPPPDISAQQEAKTLAQHGPQLGAQIRTKANPSASSGPDQRFGSGGGALASAGLDATTRQIQSFFNLIAPNRTMEMITEDAIGFGVLRSGMDGARGYLYGDNKPNGLAALERFCREVCSIITDNIAAGLAAFGIGAAMTQWAGKPHMANTFSSFESMELFEHIAKQSQHREDFLQRIVEQMDLPQTDRRSLMAHVFNWQNIEALSNTGGAAGRPTTTAMTPTDLAEKAAKLLQQEAFDVSFKPGGATYAGGHIPLPDLLEDLNALNRHVAKQMGVQAEHHPSTWSNAAKGLLETTLQVKKGRILPAMAVAATLTFTAPFAISAMTKRFFGVDTYPGQLGLDKKADARAKQPVKNAYQPGQTLQPQPYWAWRTRGQMPYQLATETGFTLPGQHFGSASGSLARFGPTQEATQPKTHNTLWQKLFPYLHQSIQQGNLLPALLTVAPLWPALGGFDTVARRFTNPLSRAFRQNWYKLFDFTKGFPFTAQQQIASLFGVLITARLASARTGIEFRERWVDSTAGWMLWILGTPAIKQGVARWMDATQGTRFIKPNGALRTAEEIQRLIAEPALRQKMLKTNIWMGAAATVSTWVLLGIVEPLAAILWTQRISQQGLTPPNTPSAPPLPVQSSLPVTQWTPPNGGRIPGGGQANIQVMRERHTH